MHPCAASLGNSVSKRIIVSVKPARPPLVQTGKPGTGGTSGLHRAAQELTAPHREVRIRATETSRFSSGETGNLCAQQHQVGQLRGGPLSWRVGGTEPGGRPPAQIDGGHGAGNRTAQNPAYRRTSHFFILQRAQQACFSPRQRTGKLMIDALRRLVEQRGFFPALLLVLLPTAGWARPANGRRRRSAGCGHQQVPARRTPDEAGKQHALPPAICCHARATHALDPYRQPKGQRAARPAAHDIPQTCGHAR